jgi:response regulator RpfG family c-di-GMP phosphodiesterase
MANILIFHDNPDYEEALNKKGHKILSFSDKDPALQSAQMHKWDLALVNADLPMGVEVLKGLRQTTPEIRLLTVMGSPSLTSLREAISLGVQEILFTPLNAGELETKVTKVAKATKRNLKEALAL